MNNDLIGAGDRIPPTYKKVRPWFPVLVLVIVNLLFLLGDAPPLVRGFIALMLIVAIVSKLQNRHSSDA